MSDNFSNLFKVGDPLILEINNGDIFEGIYAGGGRDRIALTNIVLLKNGEKTDQIHEFRRNEILEIHQFKSKDNKQVNIIEMHKEEFHRLKKISQSYTYIDSVDKRYFDAIAQLNKAEMIGVDSPGLDIQSGIINLLVICTWQKVFIFDLNNVQSKTIYPELKHILESERLLKIMHKSAPFATILYRYYNVYFRHIFDTEIIDLALQKKMLKRCPNFDRDINQCLMNYLHFPFSLLEPALKVSREKWNRRPLNDELKFFASQRVTYLITLRQHFEGLLNGKVLAATERVRAHVKELSDDEFVKFNKSKKVSKEYEKLLEGD